MDDVDSNLLDKIRQYQNSIIKHSELGNDAKILSYISKLYEMPVTVAHLQETGIGRTINSLRKYSGDVGSASKAIVYKWKDMVAREEEEDPGHEPQEPKYASPPPSPPPTEKKKVKSEDKYNRDEKHSKKSHSSEKSSRRHDSSERSSSKSKSDDHVGRSKSHHRKEEKKDSHKSSHSKEKEHRSRSDSAHKHRSEEKPRHEKKRKHEEDHSPSKKKKHEEPADSDSDVSIQLHIQEPETTIASPDQSDDNIMPDSTTENDDYIENTQSPVEKSHSSHKKHHKSDKHRNKDAEKKQINGSHSSSKKSSHREKQLNETPKKEKPTSSKSTEKEVLKESPKESSKPSKKPKLEKAKKGPVLHGDNGIDSGSGASFAEALGMMGPAKASKATFKKKSSHSASASPTPAPSTSSKPPKTPKTATQSPLAQSPNLLSPHLKLEPLEMNICSQLPEITTNYKPLGNYTCDSSPGNHVKMSEEEALSVVISSKTQRTKVYSGNKTNWGFVPSLFQLCVRVLQDNIDALEYTGGVPYEILKPVLERANANQLLNTEYFNPYLIEDSDELWELHCKRECRGMKRQEMESWRDMYLRCRDERDAKLKALTVNIKQSIDKSLPVRQTKLAYVDSVVKPPRGIARKQAKYGTDKKPLITPTARLNSIASGSGEKISVPNPGARSMSSSTVSAMKPKKAPLMQKTLALIKSRFRR